MNPITQADEQLFGSVVLAARMGRVQPIVDHLARQYEQQWDDPTAGFPYALSMLAVLHSNQMDAGEQLNYVEIIETLSDLLYHEPDHWLGRFLRIHTRTLLPTDTDEHRNYLAAERARAAEDAAELIDRQSRSAWQPWFACPYLMSAQLAWQSGDTDPQRAAALVSAAAAHPAEPIPFRALGRLMISGFLWYCNEPGTPDRETVATLVRALFPHQRAVHRTHRVGAS